MFRKRAFSRWIATLRLAGCATVSTGPSVMVLSVMGKSFEQFLNDAAIPEPLAASGGIKA